jgi:AbrB family looped-hinge helix DNA binding protein
MNRRAVFDDVDFYGAGVVSEKGQVIIPAELRKRFGINTGERLVVMGAHKTGSWVILLTKSEAVSRMVSQMVRSMFGAELDEILETGEKASLSEEPHLRKTGGTS